MLLLLLCVILAGAAEPRHHLWYQVRKQANLDPRLQLADGCADEDVSGLRPPRLREPCRLRAAQWSEVMEDNWFLHPCIFPEQPSNSALAAEPVDIVRVRVFHLTHADEFAESSSEEEIAPRGLGPLRDFLASRSAQPRQPQWTLDYRWVDARKDPYLATAVGGSLSGTWADAKERGGGDANVILDTRMLASAAIAHEKSHTVSISHDQVRVLPIFLIGSDVADHLGPVDDAVVAEWVREPSTKNVSKAHPYQLELPVIIARTKSIPRSQDGTVRREDLIPVSSLLDALTAAAAAWRLVARRPVGVEDTAPTMLEAELGPKCILSAARAVLYATHPSESVVAAEFASEHPSLWAAAVETWSKAGAAVMAHLESVAQPSSTPSARLWRRAFRHARRALEASLTVATLAHMKGGNCGDWDAVSDSPSWLNVLCWAAGGLVLSFAAGAALSVGSSARVAQVWDTRPRWFLGGVERFKPKRV